MSRWTKAGMLDAVFERLQRQRLMQVRIEAVSLDSTIRPTRGSRPTWWRLAAWRRGRTGTGSTVSLLLDGVRTARTRRRCTATWRACRVSAGSMTCTAGPWTSPLSC